MVILALILFNFIVTLVGIRAKLTLSYYGLLAHACYAISFIGGFYVYIMLDYFLTAENRAASAKAREARGEKPGALSDTVILILVSIPFFALFVMGIYSMVLLFKVDEELNARKAAEEEEAGGPPNPRE